MATGDAALYVHMLYQLSYRLEPGRIRTSDPMRSFTKKSASTAHDISKYDSNIKRLQTKFKYLQGLQPSAIFHDAK